MSRSRRTAAAAVLVLAILAVGVWGCGSGSSSASASKHRGHAPIRTYRLKLSGAAETPRGAPQGRGLAVIAFHGSSKVCWRFAHLAGFTAATFAHIHRGAAGKAGGVVVPLSTAAKLHHRGCVAAPAAVINAIERDPPGYYVNIHSQQYPGGAVRAQL
jgi:hypothetical protein